MKTAFSYMAAACIALCLLMLTSCGRAYEADSAADSAVAAKAGQTRAPNATPSRLRVTTIDVGKGDCILI